MGSPSTVAPIGEEPSERSDEVCAEAGLRARACDSDAARELGSAVGLSATLAQVLLHRGLRTVEEARAYLDPSLSGLTAPDAMVDREAAASRLADAIRRRERVVVFGDYDVDGTTSAAILADILEVLGADVVALVANRFAGGYGLSDAALDRCLAQRPGVLVTCDCGSSDHERIARARRSGVDVVVIDHHLVPDAPLSANAFLNPHRPDCAFPYKGLASAGLAFSVGAAVRACLGTKLDLRPWLDLVALGTIADVAPLDGDNRRLVRAGLERMSAGPLRPGVRALFDVVGVRAGQAIGAQDVSFRLAPRLNAVGRLGDPTPTLELLRARTDARARELANEVERANTSRRTIEREGTERAIAEVLARHGRRPEHGIVVASEGYHRGVIGITAARLVERFGVPVVVIALENGEGHGSGRTPSGVDLHAAFTACSSLLTKFGGHAAAAGLSLDASSLSEFREAFAAATPCGDRGPRSDEPTVDVVLGGAFGVPIASELRRLEPVGEGNAAPRFGAHARVKSARRVGDGEHLKLSLDVLGTPLSAFAPSFGGVVPRAGSEVRVTGTLRPDAYRGGEAVEMSVESLAPAGASTA